MPRATAGGDPSEDRASAPPPSGWTRRIARAVTMLAGGFAAAVLVTAAGGGGTFARATEGGPDAESGDVVTADTEVDDATGTEAGGDGHGGDVLEPAYLDDPQVVQRGEDLFGARCALCHGEAGRGVPREVAPNAYGPSLIGVGPAAVDFMIRTGRMPVIDPDQRLQHRPQQLSDSERQALVAYIASLAPGEGPGIPDVEGWEDADLSVGLELFTSNCAACHGPTAAGIAVGQDDVSSTLDVATPLEIAEAIRSGPGVMPVFGPDVIGDEELEAVVAWVVHLRDREAPGGLQVGRSGPVWEGLVAWVVGFGLLVVVMYLLGERSTGAHDAEPNA